MSEAYRAEFARVVQQVALAPGQKFEPVPTLTAEQVRQIVREELERARRKERVPVRWITFDEFNAEISGLPRDR